MRTFFRAAAVILILVVGGYFLTRYLAGPTLKDYAGEWQLHTDGIVVFRLILEVPEGGDALRGRLIDTTSSKVDSQGNLMDPSAGAVRYNVVNGDIVEGSLRLVMVDDGRAHAGMRMKLTGKNTADATRAWTEIPNGTSAGDTYELVRVRP